MNLVVDASVAVKWFVREAEHDLARTVLGSRHTLCAPDIILAEVANTFWKKVRRGELSAEQSQGGLNDLMAVLDSMIPAAPLMRTAMALCFELDHPIYDCVYLACAQTLGADYVTADSRFLARLTGTRFQGIARSLSASGL